MFGMFIKYRFQRTYDAILAAPVDTEELVTAEALWIAARAGVYGCAPLLVAMVFGLDPALGHAARAVHRLRSPASAWPASASATAAIATSIDNFSYITAPVLTPLFLVAGTFFPIDGLPEWAQTLAQLNPLYHCVELVRHAGVRLRGLVDLCHVACLVGVRAADVAAGDLADGEAAHRLACGQLPSTVMPQVLDIEQAVLLLEIDPPFDKRDDPARAAAPGQALASRTSRRRAGSSSTSAT